MVSVARVVGGYAQVRRRVGLLGIAGAVLVAISGVVLFVPSEGGEVHAVYPHQRYSAYPPGNACGDRMLLGATAVRSPSRRLATRTVHRQIRSPAEADNTGMGREHATPLGSAPAHSEPRERTFCVTDDLVATATEADGGQNQRNTLRGLTIDLSAGRYGR